MSAAVQVYAQQGVSADELAEVETALRELGLEPSSRVMPTRRGVEITWMVLIAFPAQALLSSTMDRLGAEAYEALKRLTGRILRRLRRDADGPRHALLLQTSDTGAKIRLEEDLPERAYRSLVEQVLHETGGGEWRYDRQQDRWTMAVAH